MFIVELAVGLVLAMSYPVDPTFVAEDSPHWNCQIHGDKDCGSVGESVSALYELWGYGTAVDCVNSEPK